MESYTGQPCPYDVRFVDDNGAVVGEQRVVATTYSSVLRELSHVPNGAARIEVFHEAGQPAGEVGVDYWQQRMRRRR